LRFVNRCIRAPCPPDPPPRLTRGFLNTPANYQIRPAVDHKEKPELARPKTLAARDVPKPAALPKDAHV
jgi:hypothetical protein